MTNSIIGFIVGCITTAFGVLLAHIFSEGRSRRKEFNQVAAEFKAAFIPELRYLDYKYSPNRGSGSNIHNTLSEAFDRHEIAVIKFRPFLNRAERTGFDKAWDDYCNKENGKPRFMVYAEPERLTDMIKRQRFYLEKLNSLITFANPK